MTAEFNCLFGISNPVDGLSEGDVDTTFDKGRNMLTITGKHGRVYWFYHEKLDKIYQVGARDFPRYSKADAENLAMKNAWRHVSETVTLGDLWEKRVSYTLVPLEEALFNTWTWGRIATVGDNAHKMTPNHGQAGNNAIESAAALANQLKKVQDDGLITSQTIKSALQRWQAKRWVRVNATVKEAAAVCRMQALDSRVAYYIMNYVVPNATESLLTLVTDTLIGAEILEYLPVPSMSFEGSCPFNPNQGIGKHESVLKRAVIATPLLIFSYWMARLTSLGGIRDSMNLLLQPGQLKHTDERTQWLQSLRFLIENSLIYAIWLIESNRRANVLTFAQFPMIFCTLALRFGIGIISPCYYFLHFICSRVEKFAAADARLTNVAYTRTILPLLLLFIGSPVFLVLTGYAFTMDQVSWHWLWRWILQPPFMVTIIQWALIKTRLSKVSMHEDTMNNPKRDLPYIRWCVYSLSAISTVTWISVIFSNTSFLSLGPGNMVGGNRHGMLLSSLFWVGLLLHDIKRAGMVQDSWAKILAVGLVAGIIGGPAVAGALGWIWREEILASKRERQALTREKYAGKSILEVQRRDMPAAGDIKPRKS